MKNKLIKILEDHLLGGGDLLLPDNNSEWGLENTDGEVFWGKSLTECLIRLTGQEVLYAQLNSAETFFHENDLWTKMSRTQSQNSKGELSNIGSNQKVILWSEND